MMGIIIDIKDKYAAVLTDNGEIRKIRANNYIIGDSVYFKEKLNSTASMRKWGTGIAAAFVFLVAGILLYFTPTGYVGLDVNPSLELTINIFHRVLDVRALNQDARDIFTESDLKHMTIEDAIEQTTEKLVEEGFINDNYCSGILITASMSSPVEAEKLVEQLRRNILHVISKRGKTAEVKAVTVSMARVGEARVLGVSPGKLDLVEKLEQNFIGTNEINREEWCRKSVKEINKAIEESLKDNHEDTISNEFEKQELGECRKIGPPGNNSEVEEDLNTEEENQELSEDDSNQGPKMPDAGGGRGQPGK